MYRSHNQGDFVAYESLLSVFLKEERKRLGLTQVKAAELARVSRETWSRYESGKLMPGAEVLTAITAAGADARYILTGTRSLATLTSDEDILLTRYRTCPQELKNAALRVVLGGEDTSSGAVTQTIHGSVSGGVAGRKIVNKGKI